MREKFNKLINRYGYKEIFFLVFYPIFLPIFMLKDTSLSVYNILKGLLKYDWKYLSGNDQQNAYNNFFYYIQDYNVQKFGRYGKSNLLAGGDFSLKNWFHVTPFSLRLQSSFGTTFIMFFAMCFWLLSWIVLYQDNSNLWLILGIVFFSTLFFAAFIEIQNYNILGWMLYPLFLTNLISGDYLVLSVVLFTISLSSFTAFFIAIILVLVNFFFTLDYLLLLALIPGAIKWVIPIVISMKDGALSKMLGAIGGHEKVKYSRSIHKKISMPKFYILGIQFVFVSFFIFSYGLYSLSGLLVCIVGLFIISELFVRFSDQQSFYLAYLSVSVFVLLELKNLDALVMMLYVFSIYPVYRLLLNVSVRGNGMIAPSARKPFNARETIERIKKLFDDIPKDSKLLIAYNNPQGEYGNIFNGYRIFNEPIQYAATLKNICLFPDWYMIFENNKENDDESFWIKGEKDAKNYMVKNDINYILLPGFFQQKWENYFILLGDYTFEINSVELTADEKKYELFLYVIKESR